MAIFRMSFVYETAFIMYFHVQWRIQGGGGESAAAPFFRPIFFFFAFFLLLLLLFTPEVGLVGRRDPYPKM